MCSKDKAHIWMIIVGIICVATSIGLLRHVFNLSTFDIIFLAPIVLVIGFAYTIKLMADVEYIHLALLTTLAIPLSCMFLFVFKMENFLEDWRSFTIFWKLGNILFLTFLIVFPCLWLLFIYSFYNETNGT
ncbi:uncharacterized protein LOC119551909 isoform X2 [Drosophila subpulchrella]|uniref:uncharacterized protein LOC119551909 isoform X2 n=1 Tax=Drosophila subpulchrella TaxID=1486046 RepID=UPI0018A1A328|nr:uncharacterized protein LOC119551909 isoform X2 [Drosophila subpulchrella]